MLSNKKIKSFNTSHIETKSKIFNRSNKRLFKLLYLSKIIHQQMMQFSTSADSQDYKTN